MSANGSVITTEQSLPGVVERRSGDVKVATARARPVGLHELEVGARAIVDGPTSYDATVIRLLEMGLTPGTEVTLSRRAPANDPIEIHVRGTRLCLRRADAARFPVRVLGARRG